MSPGNAAVDRLLKAYRKKSMSARPGRPPNISMQLDWEDTPENCDAVLAADPIEEETAWSYRTAPRPRDPSPPLRWWERLRRWVSSC